jgi:hypothetical protein
LYNLYVLLNFLFVTIRYFFWNYYFICLFTFFNYVQENEAVSTENVAGPSTRNLILGDGIKRPGGGNQVPEQANQDVLQSSKDINVEHTSGSKHCEPADNFHRTYNVS